MKNRFIPLKNYHMLLMINDIKYQEVLIVPSLNMEVPVAENTNDAVYLVQGC